jgi:beta-glucanase (GH16 family)
VLGNWAAGNHNVQVDFLNDAWGGTAATDRNLYVDGATYNGASVGGAAQNGYGTYTVEARLDGNGPGSAVLLWPGDDRWPGQEIDIAETAVDGSGRHYGTVHWDDNGNNGYNYFIYDGVYGGVFHDYSVRWEPGRITFLVDGVQKATTTEHVPTDYDAGGMNNVIGFLNNSSSTSLTIREVEYSPL